jgi:hypothetical protein
MHKDRTKGYYLAATPAALAATDYRAVGRSVTSAGRMGVRDQDPV